MLEWARTGTQYFKIAGRNKEFSRGLCGNGRLVGGNGGVVGGSPVVVGGKLVGLVGHCL